MYCLASEYCVVSELSLGLLAGSEESSLTGGSLTQVSSECQQRFHISGYFYTLRQADASILKLEVTWQTVIDYDLGEQPGSAGILRALPGCPQVLSPGLKGC